MKRLGLLMLMLLLSFVLMQAVNAVSGEPPGAVNSEQVTLKSEGLTVNSETFAEESTLSEVKGGEASPGGHISPAIDGIVTATIIPLLVLLVGLFWRSFDKNRFTQLLLGLWSLIKDADNFFAFPNAEQKRLIEDNGLNAAKKLWVAEQAVKAFKPEDVSYLKKKTGSIGNAIELAINVFKYGSTVFSVGKKLVNVFK